MKANKKELKRFIRRALKCFPALAAILGGVIVYLAAGSSDYGILCGNGSPEWTGPAATFGLILIYIGAVCALLKEKKGHTK